MAITSGVIKIEGTVEDLTFYKKDGKSFVRTDEGDAFLDALMAFNASPPPGFEPVQFLDKELD